GRDEIDGGGLPAGALERRARGALAELEGPAAEARAQLVHRLVGAERRAVDEEVAAGDVAGLEEPTTPRIVVTGQAQQLGLREALGRRGRGHRGNPWNVHAHLLSAPASRKMRSLRAYCEGSRHA